MALTVPILERMTSTPEAVHLLPGWYDEWVIFDRERLRQRLLHGMESLVRQLVSRGLLADAWQ
jgi:hypothetical protein